MPIKMTGHFGSCVKIPPQQDMCSDAEKPVHNFPPITIIRSDPVRKNPPNRDHIIGLPGMLPSGAQNSRHHVFAGPFMRVTFRFLPLDFHIYRFPGARAANRMIGANSTILAIYGRQVRRPVINNEFGFSKVTSHYTAEPMFSRLASPIGSALPIVSAFQVLTSHWLRSPMPSIPIPLRERKARSCADRGTLPLCGGALPAVFANARRASRLRIGVYCARPAVPEFSLS